eukprot:TRINITY_DN561_c1_g8_i1.p2 TRINITY_DN561_c1_g8~~TRINITY_DN561_c1_g8_i1.p2  ORF type:complete len:536 (+),score=77.49 TRINITY_DN561_c1_g8_i1:193-1800(+)
MKNKLFTPCVFVLIIGIAFFSACNDEFLEPDRNQEQKSHVLKKGGKQTDVDQADLYGDLWEMERYNSGVPILYELNYHVEYKDQPVVGVIDVVNPRLNGEFDLEVLVRDDNGYVIYESEDNPLTEIVTIIPNEYGFVEGAENVISLYDAEGEILPDVALHVVPIEFGRLDIIRSPSTVLERRLAEVIKNFGDGSVANVSRDFCGRVMMFRTDAALALGEADKPIDSPLENLAIYKELMLHGFTKSAVNNGLKFLIEEESPFGGFDLQLRVDGEWAPLPKSFLDFTVDEQNQLIMNLAASCMAAGSDKSNTLNIDEIVFVNLFMGVPEVSGNDINQPATSINCYLPTIEQEIRMMDKTDKHQYSRYRYYVDYSSFIYDREKFKKTLIDYVTIEGEYDPVTGELIGSHTILLADNLVLHDILMGEAPLTVDASAIYRYTQKEGQPTTGALGFACQADDYVQALEVVHNNEEFLVWEISTPIWTWDVPIVRGEFSPFNYVPEEESHGNKPDGKGHDTLSNEDDGSSSEGSGKKRHGRR